MKNEISILIPVYNTVCIKIVEVIARQCQQLKSNGDNFLYEILVADDCSSIKDSIKENRIINDFTNCRFIEKPENTGSAATRNFLAQASQYNWLLFLDCDMQITSQSFIADYLNTDAQGIINGGIKIGNGNNQNLRYLYEKHCEPMHTAEQRKLRPYQHFRSTNFLIERKIIIANPFDERFRKSGYEDVIFGKMLRESKVSITHIDNPTLMTDFETNEAYMDKIDRSINTLHQFRSELRGYSRLLTLVDGIHLGIVRSFIRLWHRLFGPIERRNLTGKRPSLRIFNLYRLGYYLTLTKND